MYTTVPVLLSAHNIFGFLADDPDGRLDGRQLLQFTIFFSGAKLFIWEEDGEENGAS